MQLFWIAGISYIELVITIGIMAIIATIAIPQYSTFRAQQEQQHTIHLIKHAISHAKQHTKLNHYDIILCPSLDGDHCLEQNNWQNGILIVEDRNKNRRVDSHDKRLYFSNHKLQYGTLTWHGGLNRNIIVFQSDSGLPRGYIGSFRYCNANQKNLSYRVTLSMMGHTREDPNTPCFS